MAVVQFFSKEGDAHRIEKCLSREIEAVKLLATLLRKVRNRNLTEMDIANIQMLVQEAHSGAQGAYDTVSGYLRKVQSDCEKLTEEKGRLQEARKEKKQQLSHLQAQLPNIRKEKEEYENRLRRSRESLRHAEQALEKQKETERLMKTGRNIGIGLLFIPIIGTIAGTVTVVACEIGRANAAKNYQLIKRQMQREEEYISKCSRDLETCISRITETMIEIFLTEQRINGVEDQLDSLPEHLKTCFALDYLLKHGTVAVNELLGKVEVLKFRSEKFCNVDALVIVLNDIIAHILKLPNLLDGKVLQLEASTVEMLESLSGRQKAIEWFRCQSVVLMAMTIVTVCIGLWYYRQLM
ncbi:uncharacterized protein LOC132402600 [Hypanus sabinus]|uniref:uncharacterized protein LOC132402600 n=1 Tax=Hypanus sabinus TaxID=79690 RepID=UPI0028C4988C|nr:uncharacterized protein LOC132402600 [Hypanus sabinus]